MRVALFSLKKNNLDHLRQVLKRYEIETTTTRPDIICCYGGDGTVLIAERKYPGIPKVIIKKESICHTCVNLSLESIAKALSQKKYIIRKIRKLEAEGTPLLAMNDIIIRNRKQQEALRFTLTIKGKESEEIIGDGLVIATSFGSGGYFYAITKKTFKKGIGIALNNPHNVKKKEYLSMKDIPIQINILRGEATMTADNDRQEITLKPGAKVVIRQGQKEAKIVEFSKKERL